MKTKHEITVQFGKIGRVSITIPKGTRCKPCNDGTLQYWVADLSFLADRNILHHEASHRGIRLDADQVEVPNPTWPQRVAAR